MVISPFFTITSVGACMMPYWSLSSGFSSASMTWYSWPFKNSFAIRQFGQVLVVNRYSPEGPPAAFARSSTFSCFTVTCMPLFIAELAMS